MNRFILGLLAFTGSSPTAAATTLTQLHEQVPEATHETAKTASDIGQCLVDRVSTVSRFSLIRHGDRDTLTLDDGNSLQLLVFVQDRVASVRSPLPYGAATRASVEGCF